MPGGAGNGTPSTGTAGGPKAPRPTDTVPSGGGVNTPGRPTYGGPSGPAVPGPMAPSTPGAMSPTTPGLLGGPAQPRSPRGSGVTGDDPGSWRVWWTLNHDRFVDVAVQAPTAVSDGAVHRTEVLAEVRADAYERLAPIVTRVLQQEKNDILVGRALIALAKLGENPRVANSREVHKLILPFMASERTRIAESAAIALGILGHDEAVMALSQYAALVPEGQSSKTRQDRARSFAIYGLGLAARDSKREDVRRVAASRLCEIFTNETGLAVDVKVACLQALSMVPLAPETQAMALPGAGEIPSVSRNAEIEWVLRVLDSASEATWVRAQAATTAARLSSDQGEHSKLRERVAQRLIETLSAASRDALPMRQSAALALGLLGDSDNDSLDKEIRGALGEAALFNADQTTRYYAMMSLAQAASRSGGPVQDPERLAAAASIRTMLLKRAGNGSEVDRAWNTVSLGVFEYRMRQAGESSSDSSRQALMSILEETNSPEIGGAACLALGLSGATEAEELLVRQLKNGDANVRGFAALSLGMIGARDATAALEKLLDRASGAPELYLPVSEGLAMLGAPVADRLVKSLVAGPSLEAQLALCVALGRTGGSRAVQPLSDLVDDSTGTAWVRAMAAEALGSIGDHGAARWNARYAFDVNFLALPLTATAPNYDGVLDLE